MDKIPESIQKMVDDYIDNLSRQISIEKVILFDLMQKVIRVKIVMST